MSSIFLLSFRKTMHTCDWRMNIEKWKSKVFQLIRSKNSRHFSCAAICRALFMLCVLRRTRTRNLGQSIIPFALFCCRQTHNCVHGNDKTERYTHSVHMMLASAEHFYYENSLTHKFVVAVDIVDGSKKMHIWKQFLIDVNMCFCCFCPLPVLWCQVSFSIHALLLFACAHGISNNQTIKYRNVYACIIISIT